MMKKALLVLAILAVLWYLLLFLAPRNGHSDHYYLLRVQSALRHLAQQSYSLDDDALAAEVGKISPVRYDKNAYRIHLRRDGAGVIFTAVPDSPRYESPLWRKLLLLDFTRVDYPAYTVDSREGEVREQPGPKR